MTVRLMAGGETGLIDLSQNDGEIGTSSTGNLGANVTLAAHAISGRGAGSYKCDMSVSGGKGHVQTHSIAADASATKARLTFWVELNAVTTPAFDTPIWRDAVSGGRYELRWSRLTDNKMHLFDGGSEIDSGNAFTPPSVGSGAFGTGFALRLTFLYASPFTITVESATSTTSPTTWTTHQSGAGASAPPSSIGCYFCEDLGKGVNHNWQARLDNIVGEDDLGGFTDDILDVVLEGVPTSDAGTHNDFHNSSGTACSVGGADCFSAVDELPPSATDYVECTSTASASKQSWPTDSKHLISADTVMSVKAVAYITRGSPAGSGAMGLLVVDGGTDMTLTGTAPNAGQTRWALTDVGSPVDGGGSAWTVAKAQAAEVGYQIVLPASNPALRLDAVYKMVGYRMGTPSTGVRRRGGVV